MQIYAVLHAVICPHCHVHVGEVEPSWCSGGLDVIAHGEVAITIGITARWGNVGGVDDIAVDESKLFTVSINILLEL